MSVITSSALLICISLAAAAMATAPLWVLPLNGVGAYPALTDLVVTHTVHGHPILGVSFGSAPGVLAGIRMIDSPTAELVWNYSSMTNSYYMSDIVAHNGSIFWFDTVNNAASGVDAGTGQLQWTVSFRNQFSVEETPYTIFQDAKNNLIFFGWEWNNAAGQFSEVVAVNTAKGALQWRFNALNFDGIPRVASTGSLAVFANFNMVTQLAEILAVTLSTGASAWNCTASCCLNAGGWGIAADSDYVIFSGQNQFQGWVCALNASTGALVWETYTQTWNWDNSSASTISIVASPNGRVALATGMGGVAVYDVKTGAQLWQQFATGLNPATAVGGVVYTSTAAGSIQTWDLLSGISTGQWATNCGAINSPIGHVAVHANKGATIVYSQVISTPDAMYSPAAVCAVQIS